MNLISLDTKQDAHLINACRYMKLSEKSHAKCNRDFYRRDFPLLLFRTAYQIFRGGNKLFPLLKQVTCQVLNVSASTGCQFK